MRAPRDLRAQQRVALASYRFTARLLRRYSRAIRARDLAAVERLSTSFTTGFKRFARGEPQRLRRLLYASSYSRTIKRMNRLGDRIQRAHLVLDAS